MTLIRSKFKRKMQEIDSGDFEAFLADIWDAEGFDTEVRGGPTDRGIDVMARKDYPIYESHAIQAKRHGSGNPVNLPKIREYSALNQGITGVDIVIVATTYRFSERAENKAQRLGVKTIDGDYLFEFIRERGYYQIVSKYIDYEEINLEDIPKIGDDRKKKLEDIGIETGKELAKYNIDELKENLDIPDKILIEASKHAAIQADISTKQVDGIGDAYQDKLAEASIITVSELAKANVENIVGDTDISEPKIQRWVEDAKRSTFTHQ